MGYCCNNNSSNQEGMLIVNKAREAAACAQANCSSSFENATNAANSAAAAAASETNVENIWEDFQERYMGPFASPPVAPGEGSMYYNTVSNVLFVWNGSAWVSTDFNEFTNFTAAGTTTARNLVTRMADVVNVKDFGAVGNGIVDDTAAIQAAINHKKNAILLIPSGTYLVSGDITILLKGHSPNEGGFQIEATGVLFTGAGKIIIDSCKRLQINGLDAANKTISMRGCWWSTFSNLRFTKLLIGESTGTDFSSNYWNQFIQCQLQAIIVDSASSQPSNAFWFNSCSIRGSAGQGFSGTSNYAFEFNSNQNCQNWVYSSGDVSYNLIDIYNVGIGNINGELELSFHGTYFDTFYPKPTSRNKTRIQTKYCFSANDVIYQSFDSQLTHGGHDAFRNDRASGWQQFSSINYIPNGDFRVGLPSYVGSGLPISFAGGATITEQSGGGNFGRYLNINQVTPGVAGTVYIKAKPLPFTGRYSAALFIKNADPGSRTMRVAFNNLFQVININNTQWSYFNLTSGQNIIAGSTPDILFRADDDISTFNVDVCYAAITFGENGMPNILASPYNEIIGSKTFNPPDIPDGTQTSTTVTVTGASLGDFVIPSFNLDLQGIILSGYISSSNTATIIFKNDSGSPINLAEGTLRAKVISKSYI